MKTRLAKSLAGACLLVALSACGGMDSPRSEAPVKGKPISQEAQAQANLQAELEGMKSQVQRLTAEVEDLSLQVRTLTEGDASSGAATLPELGARIAKVEANLRQMGSQLGVEVDGQQPAQAAQATQQPAAPQAPSKPTDVPQAATNVDPAEAIYAKGMQAFQAKDYDKAIALWRDVAKSYPKHSLAPNAYFWLGEANFQKGDMGQAVLNYNEVVEKFPKSNKTPSAMLKMGMAFQKLNKKDAARLMFQDLIKKFPESAEARRAKTLL